MTDDLFFENLCTVLPIFGVAFDEGPSINIANIGFTVGPEEIEPTNVLAKLFDDSIADIFFIRCEDDWVPHLFAFFIPEDNTIKAR